MKKAIITGIITIVTALTVVGTTAHASTTRKAPTDTASGYYAKVAEVIDVDERHNIVTVEDATGNIWKYYGIEDYYKGDIVAMLMDNNGTTNTIYDDIIVNVTFSGYTSEDFND